MRVHTCVCAYVRVCMHVCVCTCKCQLCVMTADLTPPQELGERVDPGGVKGAIETDPCHSLCSLQDSGQRVYNVMHRHTYTHTHTHTVADMHLVSLPEDVEEAINPVPV